MYAVLYIPEFALQAVLRTEPEAHGHAAALFTDNNKKSVVLAANPAAQARSIEVGMTAPQAVARCPDLRVRTPNRAAEAEAHAALLAVGFTVSPTIEDTAPGVCTIDLKGAAPVMHEPGARAAVIQLAALGFRASAGIGATPLLALYAARAADTASVRGVSVAAVGDRSGVTPGSASRATAQPTQPKDVGGVPPPRGFMAPNGARGEGTPPTIEPGAKGMNPAKFAASTSSASRAGRGSDHALPQSVGEAAAEYEESDPRDRAHARDHDRDHDHARDRDHAHARARTLRSPESESSTSTSTSKSTSDRLRVLTVTDARSFLAPLPLAAADPSPEIAGILGSWGLRMFGDLTALPRDDVGRRLGTEGLAVWDRAGGGAPRPLRPVALPQTFAAEMDFEEEVETLEPLLFILRRFLERLTLDLRTSGLVASALELRLKLADDTQHQRAFRLPDPTADVEILFRALHTHLESLRTEASIIGLQLRAEPTRPLVRQHGLFDTGLRDPHGFAETLARIVAVVGSERVGTPHLEDTHRPDAVRLLAPAAVVPPPAPPPVHRPVGPPLRRFRPPLRAQLELTNGKPTYLWTDRFNGPIAQVRGPWLSSGKWWQADRSWRRSEYDVALEHGGLYRLVLTDRSWFIEGEYD